MTKCWKKRVCQTKILNTIDWSVRKASREICEICALILIRETAFKWNFGPILIHVLLGSWKKVMGMKGLPPPSVCIWGSGLYLAWILRPGGTFHPQNGGNRGSVAVWGAFLSYMVFYPVNSSNRQNCYILIGFHHTVAIWGAFLSNRVFYPVSSSNCHGYYILIVFHYIAANWGAYKVKYPVTRKGSSNCHGMMKTNQYITILAIARAYRVKYPVTQKGSSNCRAPAFATVLRVSSSWEPLRSPRGQG